MAFSSVELIWLNTKFLKFGVTIAWVMLKNLRNNKLGHIQLGNIVRTIVGPKVRKYNNIEDIPKSRYILNYFSTYLQFGISNYSVLPSKKCSVNRNVDRFWEKKC